ncbi:MAG TPA: glycosyltransferase WbuB [Candidatus Atribacteria bacterium]|nr:glycosyltransferase WbuB [Candidatus Atribacteria bacterium]
MKILLVQETDWLEKGPLQQNHLMERLSLKGHEIRVIDYEILWKTHGKKELLSKREINNVSRVYKGANITLIRPPLIKIPHLDYISLVFSRKREINKQIREFNPDVIVGFQILTPYIAMKAAKKNNIPFIYYWTDVYHTQIPFKPYQPIGKYIEKKILRNSDKVIVINEKLKEFVVKMGSDPKKTHVEKAGMDFNRFNLEIDGSWIREKYGIKKEDFVLFFVGWLYDFGGLKEVAIRLSEVLDKNPNIKLLIVGEGDAYNDLQKIQKEYHLDNNMILTGKQPYEKVPDFISAADICLLPAYPTEKMMQEIVPIKTYEYMAMNKPVIATKLPGVMKEFGEDHGVIYVEKPEDTLDKAIELIENGTIKEHGLRARRFVEKYNWDNVVNDFEAILEELT